MSKKTKTDEIMDKILEPAGPYPWHTHENRQGTFMHRHNDLAEHRHVSRIRVDFYPFHVSIRSPEPPINKGRGVPRAPSFAPQCKYGHEYTPENTYLNLNTNSRECRQCRNDATARSRQKGKITT